MMLHPFVQTVRALRFESCFNPYSDRCDIHDRRDAPDRRASALSEILDIAIREPIESIWIGRDLGYRGGRRTGLALTDDVHIATHAMRWGVVAERATVGPAVAERTAAVIWAMLERLDVRIFLWNVFPLHPHETSDPFTNRQHNARERDAGEELLRSLIKLLAPARIVAIGNDATHSACRVAGETPVAYVRHPSYGGTSEFARQIEELYDVPQIQKQLL